MKQVLIWIARAWQLGPSRILPPTCRYMPSCSQYAIEALQKYGAIKGGWLATKRPWKRRPARCAMRSSGSASIVWSDTMCRSR